MGYRNLTECVTDLEANGHLVRIDEEVDPFLEIGSIQRRVYAAGGPALLFTRAQNTRFPLLGNLFGTLERTRFLFRDTLNKVQQLIQLKTDPSSIFKSPLSSASALAGAVSMLPRKVRSGPILFHETTIDSLPQLQSWPQDGGAFVTLPQVYSEDPLQPGWRHSNLGMYRVQLSGGSYQANREIGLHYQIHRGIGIHHEKALREGRPFKVNIFVGGPPSLTVAAVMPLPESLPEIAFAGLLGGRRLPLICRSGQLPIPAEADFCITGTVIPGKNLPEGPFGDHLGYYSLVHDFPVLQVEKVYHRAGAIWPFTTVGRPPQEDTSFGEFIHELTGPLIPEVLPGVKAVHAVDAAGVHPLLLAIGQERYSPYETGGYPQEILTQANAILGQGQLSLAKYLWIAAAGDNPELDVHDVPLFLRHMLERVDWRRDLHFQTQTTVDTLDYSGKSLNEGSKVVIAAVGSVKRTLPTEIPGDLRLPFGFSEPRLTQPGILVVKGPPSGKERGRQDSLVEGFCEFFSLKDRINDFPLIVIVDDSDFVCRNLNNFLWVCFTRSDPASDIYGIGAFIDCKHWGCTGSLIIDARLKPFYPNPLEEDPEVEKRVDALGAPGGPLHRII